MTQAGTMRCRGTTPQDPRQADHRVQAGGVTITGQPRSPGHRRPGSAGTRSLAAAWAAVDPACHPDGDAGRTRRRHRRCLPRAAHRLWLLARQRACTEPPFWTGTGFLVLISWGTQI